MGSIEEIISICKNYSMISVERFMENIKAVEYIEKNNIEGCIIEIGVWKGGSILAMMMFNELYSKNYRDFHLYDTFEGMTPSTEVDKDMNNIPAQRILEQNSWGNCVSSLEDVQNNIKRHSKIVPNYHVGDILKNKFIPEKIAILRLDTDWYESTKYELDTFYDNVSPGGVVIIDDYGHWQGCKKAVDEFLEKHPEIKLEVTDYTGRYFYKPRF